jgi:hypothetical protein
MRILTYKIWSYAHRLKALGRYSHGVPRLLRLRGYIRMGYHLSRQRDNVIAPRVGAAVARDERGGWGNKKRGSRGSGDRR